MRNEWVKRNKWIYAAGPLALALFVWIGGEVVMHLWNWLLPMLFGVSTITFWQALGLVLLSRILFGRWGHGRHRGGWHHFHDDRWKSMTPEEREKFRREMRARWWGRDPDADTGDPTRS
ncbi:MAG: hypothetical protein WB424_16245 [Terracidiphilus sp.]|jgi:hypothetical protein